MKKGAKVKMGINCDFSGWATRNDLLCGDGRTIRKDAFAQNDGCQVPLVWNHKHDDVNAVLGHAVLENRPDGVYAYGVFNDSPQGQKAKDLVQNGDVRSLSIWANELKQIGGDVIHGNIRELSLVLAGANPGAYVDFVMAHSTEEEDSLYASWDENIMLHHSADGEKGDSKMEGGNKPEEKKNEGDDKPEEKTIQDVIDTMNEEQQEVFYGVLAQAIGEKEEKDGSEGGDNSMKHNVFDKNNETAQQNVLSHSDEMAIVALAKKSGVGSLQQAMAIYAEENKDTLSHGIFDDSVEELFPEYELLKKGEPETLERDQSWIGSVISKIHKSPISRIRTRQADARIAKLRASGYQKKGNYKHESEQIKLLNRTTDPQTIYIKDTMHRDDIVDITDFDVVAYQWNMMRHVLDEEMAMAALVGDGRDDGDPDKIHEDHIRSVWHDDELYTIHQVVDFEAAKTKLQGTNTGANFSENYIKAEAMIESALYSREKFKGSGTPDLYCTPHLLNVMLLARDLNGRRIYDSKADLAKALNVNEIHTVEQFEGLERTADDGKRKLLGLFVNMADYQFGATKGGEVTRFSDFDIDFNQYKYMLETRLSGALTKVYSAIALEEKVS
uniref:Major capsid protein n=1 Tax=Siphoviridae sp. ctmYS12 TaxID=2825652 RepID=A0A8S5P681_9CAUD|nr:MAG TPA: major capsid protein [Siphoviridae sp. ctmYS12]